MFAYARPGTLRRTLECLRQNEVPQLYAFCDGCEVRRGRSRRPGRASNGSRDHVDEGRDHRAQREPRSRPLDPQRRRGGARQARSLLVFEDDLICVPGTYRYLAAALEHYRDDEKIMSVTGWTHRRVTPPGVGNLPYFDGRAESLAWGTWKRAWKGMDRDAASLIAECRLRGIDPTRFGSDVLDMAAVEQKRNIWAVRWVCLHLLRGGLCMRPPTSMVDHIGLDHGRATPAATRCGRRRLARRPRSRPSGRRPSRIPHALRCGARSAAVPNAADCAGSPSAGSSALPRQDASLW